MGWFVLIILLAPLIFGALALFFAGLAALAVLWGACNLMVWILGMWEARHPTLTASKPRHMGSEIPARPPYQYSARTEALHPPEARACAEAEAEAEAQARVLSRAEAQARVLSRAEAHYSARAGAKRAARLRAQAPGQVPAPHRVAAPTPTWVAAPAQLRAHVPAPAPTQATSEIWPKWSSSHRRYMDGELAHWQEQFDALNSSVRPNAKSSSNPKSKASGAK
ncbi:hypothetical protein [Arthrobacter sp. R4-81]